MANNRKRHVFKCQLQREQRSKKEVRLVRSAGFWRWSPRTTSSSPTPGTSRTWKSSSTPWKTTTTCRTSTTTGSRSKVQQRGFSRSPKQNHSQAAPFCPCAKGCFFLRQFRQNDTARRNTLQKGIWRTNVSGSKNM